MTANLPNERFIDNEEKAFQAAVSDFIKYLRQRFTMTDWPDRVSMKDEIAFRMIWRAAREYNNDY